ncbi:MAG: 3-hydroxyacyl-CoA dehydrogenase/enoyl-CoA hydratase family protein [Rhodothermales bacterium]
MEATAQDIQTHLVTHPFRTVAVLGAGTMGAQIAAHCANAGLQVLLLDIAGKDGASANSIVEKAFKRTTKMKPAPFFTAEAQKRIKLGNFDEHWEWLADADWIIEAVIERIDIKQSVMARIEAVARPDAIISTNTSGIPIREIAEGRSESFRQRFIGTHFFNPPRYLKLLELIPTADTAPDVTERVAHFGRVHLGKGIVIANDVPYFVGNRIGIYALMKAMQYFTNGQYSIEEIDTLTGTLVGHPKSATFRTADVVGLDVMSYVASTLYEKAVDDESRDMFKVPPLVEQLVANGALGAKTKAGFYRKDGKVIKSIDPATGEYTDPAPLDLPGIDSLKQKPLAERLNGLFEDDGRAGQFFRETTLDLLAYAARRVPEITGNPANVDKAIRWGFGWEQGPFEIWDTLGFERVRTAMHAADIALPAWVDAMAEAGHTSFYREDAGTQDVYHPEEAAYHTEQAPADEISLATVKADANNVLWQNTDAALLDLGDGVALYEFRSKANTLGAYVMNGLLEVIDKIEADRDLRGLVIGNEGSNFSVGANLGEVAMTVAAGQFDTLERQVARFQDVVQRIRYAAKPVVVAPHQRALGGACELTMACPQPVLAAETYIGLVELGVGLIPAGTGTMTLAALASERAPNGHDSEIFESLQKFFETVAMAKVATSAREAIDLGFATPSARIVMNDARRFFVAKQEVLRLSEQGYLPPPVRSHIKVLGQPAHAAMQIAIHQFRSGQYISAYDGYLAERFGYVLAGGSLSASQDVHEDYLIDLEREVFMHLLGQEKTQARIMHLLQTGKPLRN